VSAYRDGERVVVLIPDQFSRAEEREWVDRMLERLAARDQRTRRTDTELGARATRLAERYLPGHPTAARPASVRWVSNQNGRWGSCTPADRSIRISDRIMDMPDWVIDYVLLHELAHLWCRATAPPSGRSSRGTRSPSGPAGTWRGSVRRPDRRSTRIDR
jgi:Predicted metal-dependent hydrolase